jgi:thiamine pyrophosphokinase
MWTATCVRLLERYGVGDAERVFAEHESLDMDKKCYWYHDNLGIGESGEALYHELWDMVEHEYRHGVQPFPGCAELLERLRAAHVPMVVASSTPIELLRIALEAHGLLGYFDELVFAGDVGRGKEHPDVYLAACERLGTSRESTWVFEDAPFGMRSAARAGFPVVGVLNDHDGRDEGFI